MLLDDDDLTLDVVVAAVAVAVADVVTSIDWNEG